MLVLSYTSALRLHRGSLWRFRGALVSGVLGLACVALRCVSVALHGGIELWGILVFILACLLEFDRLSFFDN